MEYLLLVTYGSIFAALIVYVIYLRSQLRKLEQRFEDITAEQEQ